MQRMAGHSDFSGWVVAALFVLFLLSVVVYRVASLNFPAVETVATDATRVPLPAGPRARAPEVLR